VYYKATHLSKDRRNFQWSRLFSHSLTIDNYGKENIKEKNWLVRKFFLRTYIRNKLEMCKHPKMDPTGSNLLCSLLHKLVFLGLLIYHHQ
jgi:hypothetical protein